MSLDKTQPNPEQPLDVHKRGSMIDLSAVRAKLQQDGPQVWRSLDEAANTQEFQQYLHQPRSACQ